MARYYTRCQDFVKFKPHGTHKFCIRTVQQGTTEYTRKKKNVCKLVSTGEIKRVERSRPRFHISAEQAYTEDVYHHRQKVERAKVYIYKVVLNGETLRECESWDHANNTINRGEETKDSRGNLVDIKGAKIVRVENAS